MKKSKENLEKSFATVEVMSLRILGYIQSKSDKRLFLRDVSSELGFPPDQVYVAKHRNTLVFVAYVTAWCLKNDLSVDYFVSASPKTTSFN